MVNNEAKVIYSPYSPLNNKTHRLNAIVVIKKHGRIIRISQCGRFRCRFVKLVLFNQLGPQSSFGKLKITKMDLLTTQTFLKILQLIRKIKIGAEIFTSLIN